MISLPDWVFYPFAALVCGGMIAGALSLGETVRRTPEEIRTEGLTFEGDQLNAVTTGNGLTATLLSQGDDIYLQIFAERGPLDGIQSAGAFFALSPEELQALSGHRVRLTVRARATGERAAEGLRVNFFTPGVGQEAWQRFEVTDEYSDIVVDMVPPECSWSFGYVGLWPDWSSDADTVDIARVDLTALEPLDC
jgi:hypothetical protein